MTNPGPSFCSSRLKGVLGIFHPAALIRWLMIILLSLPVKAQNSAPASSTNSPALPDDPVHIQFGKYSSQKMEDGSFALVCPEGFYAWQRISSQDAFVELRAQRAVVFYDLNQLTNTAASANPDPNSTTADAPPVGIYLEGDVVLQVDKFGGIQDNRFTADSLYYDLRTHTALIQQSTLRMMLADQQVPIYIRAGQFRQLNLHEYRADRVQVTNDDFHTPHVWLGVDKIRILTATADSSRPGSSLPASSFDLKNITVNMSHTPVFWWPGTRKLSVNNPTPLTAASVSNRTDLGFSLETEWDLAWLLGFKQPQGINSRLRLDEYGKRGPGAGVETEYAREEFFGDFKSYIQQDQGEDRLGRFASRKDIVPENDLRGRLKWQHRQYLPNDWQASLELNYLSDETWLESWEEREFDTEKPPETSLYLKQQRNNWAIDLLSSVRLNSFDYAMQQQPTAGFHIAGQRLFDTITWDHDGYISRVDEAAGQRWVSGMGNGLESWTIPDMVENDAYTYGLSRHEFALPLQAGPVNFSPTAIGTYLYDDSDTGDNSLLQGAGGMRASTTFWNSDSSVHSRFWDVNQMRHIVTPELSVFAVESDQPDDPARNVMNMSIFQRWQTKRGPIDNQHTVDLFRLNTGLTLVDHDDETALIPNRFFFSNPERQFGLRPYFNSDLSNMDMARRKNNYLTFSDFAESEMSWQISETTALSGLVNYNLKTSVFSQTGSTLSVEHSPRLKYYLGYYFLKDGDAFRHEDGQYVNGGASYQLTDKYTFAFTQQYDLTRSAANYTRGALIRRFPRWFGALSVGYDATRESMSFTLSVWPEGLGDLVLGSRRYTRLEP